MQKILRKEFATVKHHLASRRKARQASDNAAQTQRPMIANPGFALGINASQRKLSLMPGILEAVAEVAVLISSLRWLASTALASALTIAYPRSRLELMALRIHSTMPDLGDCRK